MKQKSGICACARACACVRACACGRASACVSVHDFCERVRVRMRLSLPLHLPACACTRAQSVFRLVQMTARRETGGAAKGSKTQEEKRDKEHLDNVTHLTLSLLSGC